jgi:hypothetical protein
MVPEKALLAIVKDLRFVSAPIEDGSVPFKALAARLIDVRLVKLPNVLGSVPLSPVLVRVNDVSAVNAERSGSVPLRDKPNSDVGKEIDVELRGCDTSKLVEFRGARLGLLPRLQVTPAARHSVMSVEGTAPLNRFELKSRYVSAEAVPNHVGIVPLRPLKCRSRYVKDAMLRLKSGMKPVRPELDMST